MYNYDDLKNIFLEKECILLSTKEEIEEQKKIPKVNFIASCGHENIVFVNVFISRNTGVICKNCHFKKNKKKEDDISGLEKEYNGVLKLKSHIENDFCIKKICDGAEIDYAIKPKNNISDLYLGLQIKTTNNGNNNMYSFNIHKKYKDIIIICIQTDLELYWLIDGNIDLPKRLNITYKKGSKYDIYKISKEFLSEKLIDLYDTYKLHNFNIINISDNVCQQKEQEYMILREEKINLKFIYPDYEGCVYDFIIFEKKFQEKIAHARKSGYSCQFFKHNGKKDGISKYQNYIKGDNDFYWINIPDKNYFYVIPEFEMLKHDLISEFKREGSKSFRLHPKKQDYLRSWTNEYLFEYNNVDLEKLKELIEIDKYINIIDMWNNLKI